MGNVKDILASFKSSLNSIISDYEEKISEIEQEEEFNVVLSDFINYCKSDILLLPLASEAAIIALCDKLFDGGTTISPESLEGFIITSIIIPP